MHAASIARQSPGRCRARGVRSTIFTRSSSGALGSFQAWQSLERCRRSLHCGHRTRLRSRSGRPPHSSRSQGVLAAPAASMFSNGSLLPRRSRAVVYRAAGRRTRLDDFFLDLRSYRGPNTSGMQNVIDDESRILGAAQLEWLKRELASSTAIWKVIASDMPLGLPVPDKAEGRSTYIEAISNGRPGEPTGRELEIAELLRHIRDTGIGRNMIWLTSDWHYTAAHRSDDGLTAEARRRYGNRSVSTIASPRPTCPAAEAHGRADTRSPTLRLAGGFRHRPADQHGDRDCSCSRSARCWLSRARCCWRSRRTTSASSSASRRSE